MRPASFADQNGIFKYPHLYPKDCRSVQNLRMINQQKNSNNKIADCKQRHKSCQNYGTILVFKAPIFGKLQIHQ
jgi:hypothetical protein